MEGPKNSYMLNQKKPMLERVGFLEEAVSALNTDREKLVSGIQNALDRLQYINTKTAEIVEGILRALGPEFAPKFQEAVKLNKSESETRVALKQKEEVEKLLSENKLKPVETIGDNCLIVGREFDLNGNVVHPGRAQVTTSELEESIRKELLGKNVGAIVDTLTKTKFEVTEIYEPVKEADSTNLDVGVSNTNG